MTIWIEPLILPGNYCTIEPLTHTHCDELVRAVKDGELWNLPYAMVPIPTEMSNEITRRLDLWKKGNLLPFVVIDNESKKAIGMTNYCHIDSSNRRLDIGWTWYAKNYQKTAINTECKFLLLTHAFEKLNCIYVGFRVDYLNRQSRQAVERLGAKLEGVIRNYAILPNGHIRDMCFYSILPNEWPIIKSHLHWLLKKPRSVAL